MIAIGTDIVEISRIKSLINEKGSIFLNKIFTLKEIEYCNSNSSPSVHFSGKFAAKESIQKALLSKNLIDFISLKNIEILNREDKAPKVILHDKIDEKVSCNVSISHDGGYAVSFVMVDY